MRLARRLRAEGYGTALVMSRKWKAAFAPFLAGISERIGFVGEARLFLLNDIRWGERTYPRMVDQCAALAIARNQPLPDPLPAPQLIIPPGEIAAWRARRSLAITGRPIVALAPGAVGPAKRWPITSYRDLARRLTSQGGEVWVVGGPREKALAQEIAVSGSAGIHDLTGPDLRDAILALGAADAAVSNDSGLLHVAAALGTRAAGIFGPTSPRLWAPLNPLLGTIETRTQLVCRPCHESVCRLNHHRCMRDIEVEQIFSLVQGVLAESDARAKP
jgi:heptosyltransferase-2